MNNSARLLGQEGPFAKAYQWFKVRECQQEMADAVDTAIAGKSNLIIESGTGTGKTFGYLVPALASGKKTIVSTRTKNLQEQISKSDIPWVCEVLGVDPKVKILKGRSNYLCLYYHDQLSRQGDFFAEAERVNHVYDWVTERGDGDISEYPGLPEKIALVITSTAENCLGSQCEYAKECYVNRARKEAREADVVVVNHSLLCLNFLNSEGDESGLVSSRDVVIIDEAHRFPEIASQALGTFFSDRQINDLTKNLQFAAKEMSDYPSWIEDSAKQLLRMMTEARASLSGRFGKCSMAEVQSNSEFMRIFQGICTELEELIENIEPHIDESSAMERCRNQVADILQAGNQIFESQGEEIASWCEMRPNGFELSRIPLEPGIEFGCRVDEFNGSWVFTSATLAVGSDFSHFSGRLGVRDVTSVQLASPFDYKTQALIYLPPSMPQPNSDGYEKAIVELVMKTVPVTKGRTFVLFTSHQAMNIAYELLEGQLDYSLLCQGKEGSNATLLERFRNDGNAVLLGTSSFWEGVDVKGDALSCVMIAKLPFLPPNDPVFAARDELLSARGRSSFSEWQIPSAVLTMKQGVGRLIRDDTDKGLLVLCDPRIRTKQYGQEFLNSLPPMPLTDKFDVVRKFFKQ